MKIRLYREPPGLAKLIIGRAREVGAHIELDTDNYPGGMPRTGDVIIDPQGSGQARRGPEAEQLYEVINSYLAPIQNKKSNAVLAWEVRTAVRTRTAYDREEFMVYPKAEAKPNM